MQAVNCRRWTGFGRVMSRQYGSPGCAVARCAAALVLAGLGASMLPGGPALAQTPLADARKGFATTFHEDRRLGEPVPPPTAKQGRLVHYPSAVGPLAALLSAVPADGRRHPAIIWLTGGDANTIDGSVWNADPPGNDQTARQYREAGIVTLYPSLRGGNNNPGHREGYFGEVDDVLAAADWLAAQPGINPQRIYVGGHSTGATLVLLVAESSSRFRAAFAFGPAADPAEYQGEDVPLDPTNKREMALRRPVAWLDSVQAPLHVFEGASGPVSNLGDLRSLQRATHNPQLHFHPVVGANHFSVLAPTNQLIARKILDDVGPTSNITFTTDELDALFQR